MTFDRSLFLSMLFALLTVSAWAQQPAYTDYTYDGYHVGDNYYSGGDETNARKLIDNNANTKYCVVYKQDYWMSETWVDFHTDEFIVPVGYVLTTGDDANLYPERNPKSWTIYGKRWESDKWTVLASETNNTSLPYANLQEVEFALSTQGVAYKYFRFQLNAVKEGGTGQLQGFHFLATPIDIPYTIATKADWDNFCSIVNDCHSYVGETVTLAADVGTQEAPVTTMAGLLDHDFRGTFDGNGHTLYVSYGSQESPIAEEFVAPFRYTNGDQGPVTFRNLAISGTIYTNGEHTGGSDSKDMLVLAIAKFRRFALTIIWARKSMWSMSTLRGSVSFGAAFTN